MIQENLLICFLLDKKQFYCRILHFKITPLRLYHQMNIHLFIFALQWSWKIDQGDNYKITTQSIRISKVRWKKLTSNWLVFFTLIGPAAPALVINLGELLIARRRAIASQELNIRNRRNFSTLMVVTWQKSMSTDKIISSVNIKFLNYQITRKCNNDFLLQSAYLPPWNVLVVISTSTRELADECVERLKLYT